MAKTTLLLADDHAVVRAGILNAIKELPGLEIIGEVGDGPSLFHALAHHRPNLLLLDVTMPQFDPIPAIGQIRALYPHMKILVVTAYDDDVYVQGLLGVGVHGYHLKDQPLADLRLAVQRVLQGERWVSSRVLSRLLHPATEAGERPALTERQREILRLLRQGMDNQSIARQTSLSVKTVENHLTRIYRQLGVQSRLEALNHIMAHPDLIGEAGHALPPPAPARPGGDEVSLLLVDDNARYRAQLRRMVGKVYPQATIYEAENIAGALAVARRVDLRLVLVDVVLGDEDGIQCTRALKARLPAARIILISAYPDREFHRRGLEAGAVAFLDKKDLDGKTLRQVIEDVAL
ncbi:MAG: response regulator [Anaerolineales bacterium]|nr:response regulator [Anaerolineales bacterium]MCB8952781.1 response regulator [Ardenticatenales bacterium]